MGQVYVIRKEAGVALSPGGGIQQIWMPGQSNEPQRFAGVTGGIGDLGRHAVTQQYVAKPIEEASSKNQLAFREGDIYGARGLNIRSKLDETPDFDPSQDRGQQIADQMARRGAQQKVFDRSAKYGQKGANFGRGLAAGIGVLAGAVNLANAGAQGQDALTGGLGAAQMGSMTYQQGKKPLSEAGGEVGAQVGARSVRVAEPTAAKQHQPPDAVGIAAPNPMPKPTPEQQQAARDSAAMRAYGQDPKAVPATLGHYGAFADKRAEKDQAQALSMIGVQNPYNLSSQYNPQGNPLTDVQPSPTKIGVAGQPQLRLYHEDTGEELPSPQPQVAPATTNTQQEQTDPNITGNIIGDELNTQGQLPGATPQQTGEIIAAAKNPAAEATDTEASMASQGHTKKMVGVVGSKKIVGVI
tara:strand:- start:6663 stop:7898 length:1236 start_codon:yes stop_codon:yes gene_type:complete